MRNYFDQVRVRYVSTEELTNDFIARSSQNRSGFPADIATSTLLIDDIQFLGGKEQTQEEFFPLQYLHSAEADLMTSSPPNCWRIWNPVLASWLVSPTCNRRPGDPDCDLAQEGRPGAPGGRAGSAGVHREPDPDQHP